MKKYLLLLIFSIFAGTSIFAQISVDSNDYFYNQVQIWEIKGLVKNIPPVRPYKKSTINEILATVIENGSEKDAEIAKVYYQQLNNKPWNVDIHSKYSVVVEDKKFDNLLQIHPIVFGDISFYKDIVSFGYKIGVSMLTKDFEDETPQYECEFLPIYENSVNDAKNDPVDVWKFNGYIDSDEILYIGTNNLYLQTGIYRPGFGDFLGDGLVLSESAFHYGNIAFTYFGSKFNFVQQYSVIGATTTYNGSGLEPEKYTAFHQFQFKPVKQISLGYYESIVYGKRFDFAYFFPAPYMTVQGIGGYADNLLMGINLNYSPMNKLKFASDLIVDDISFNELAKFNFDSRYRFGTKLGVFYTPENIFLTKIGLNYTLITPYTYSHGQYDINNGVSSINSKTYNYQNYTNDGDHIGTKYDPNTDAFNLCFDFNPVKNLYIVFNNFYIRHGNVCENYTDDEALIFLSAKEGCYSTDGSIYTNSTYLDSKSEYGALIGTGENHLNLLNQKHLMHIVKSSIDIKYLLPNLTKNISFAISGNYTFQFIHNYGVGNHLYPGGQIVQNQDGTYTCKGTGKKYRNYDEVKKDASNIADFYKKKWADSLYDLFTNYFSIGFELKF